MSYVVGKLSFPKNHRTISVGTYTISQLAFVGLADYAEDVAERVFLAEGAGAAEVGEGRVGKADGDIVIVSYGADYISEGYVVEVIESVHHTTFIQAYLLYEYGK